MALVKKTRTKSGPAVDEEGAGDSSAHKQQIQRQAEAERRRARTMAKQQQAAERIASATTQLSSGINEAASAAEELKRAMDQIAAGAEEAAGAAQESLRGVTMTSQLINDNMKAASVSLQKSENLQTLTATVSAEIAKTVTSLAANMLFHAGGGEIRLNTIKQPHRVGIEVVAQDQGPGIANVELALSDGFTTSDGLGCSLPGAKRLIDEMEIQSEPGWGTRILARKWGAVRHDSTTDRLALPTEGLI